MPASTPRTTTSCTTSIHVANKESNMATDEKGGIYGNPQRNMVGYGSSAPDPMWPGGVSVD